ncbi:MAG: hypothetical protein R3A52_05775 [Polyangiales bacterium]
MIRGYDARSWHRLVTMVAPGLVSRPPSERARRDDTRGGLVLALFDDDLLVHAVHTTRGPVEVDAWDGPSTLTAMMDATGARFGAAARVGAIETLLERLGGRVHPDDDVAEVVTTALGAVRELVDDGALVLRPSLPGGVPLPSADVLRRGWNVLLPPGQALVLALYGDGGLDTCAVVSRDARGRLVVEGPESLAALTGPLSGDPWRDHRRVREAVERARGPLAFGLFAPTSVVERLLRDETPGAWAGAIAARAVVAEPLPAWLAIAAGAGAARRAASVARSTLGGSRWFEPLARRVRDAVDRAAELDPAAMTGPELLQALASLLRVSATRPEDTRDDDAG